MEDLYVPKPFLRDPHTGSVSVPLDLVSAVSPAGHFLSPILESKAASTPAVEIFGSVSVLAATEVAAFG